MWKERVKSGRKHPRKRWKVYKCNGVRISFAMKQKRGWCDCKQNVSHRTKEVARFSPRGDLQDGTQETGTQRNISWTLWNKTLMCEGDICICSCKWLKQCSLDPSYTAQNTSCRHRNLSSPEWSSLAINLKSMRTWVQIPSLSPWCFFLEFFPVTLRMKPKLWTVYST